MDLTPYQAKYFAYDLTKRCPSDSIEKLAGAVASAQVDLNPHQVEAALLAFNSPLWKGALLVDEVGLGKTIEAGLILSRKWAERNAQFFEAEIEKLDGWADDLKPCLEREIKEIDRELNETTSRRSGRY